MQKRETEERESKCEWKENKKRENRKTEWREKKEHTECDVVWSKHGRDEGI